MGLPSLSQDIWMYVVILTPRGRQASAPDGWKEDYVSLSLSFCAAQDPAICLGHEHLVLIHIGSQDCMRMH